REVAMGEGARGDDLRQKAKAGAGATPEAEEPTPADLIADHVANEGWHRLAGQFGPVLFKTHPASVLGHMSEEFFRLALIAHLSRSKDLRRAARSRPELLAQTLKADEVSGAHPSFLAIMLRVLDDEVLLVLHVLERKGFEVRISGIADNFQLHTLLAGAIIGLAARGLIAGRGPSPRAVAECRDARVEQRGGDNVTGAFNLCNW